jgi:hypothetical protein
MRAVYIIDEERRGGGGQGERWEEGGKE